MDFYSNDGASASVVPSSSRGVCASGGAASSSPATLPFIHLQLDGGENLNEKFLVRRRSSAEASTASYLWDAIGDLESVGRLDLSTPVPESNHHHLPQFSIPPPSLSLAAGGLELDAAAARFAAKLAVGPFQTLPSLAPSALASSMKVSGARVSVRARAVPPVQIDVSDDSVTPQLTPSSELGDDGYLHGMCDHHKTMHTHEEHEHEHEREEEDELVEEDDEDDDDEEMADPDDEDYEEESSRGSRAAKSSGRGHHHARSSNTALATASSTKKSPSTSTSSTGGAPTKTKQKTCTLCGKTYQTREGLRLHIRNIHVVDKRHACTSCDRAFVRAGDLRLHVMRMHAEAGDRPFPCAVDGCNKTFACRSELMRHEKTHSKGSKRARRARVEEFDEDDEEN